MTLYYKRGQANDFVSFQIRTQGVMPRIDIRGANLIASLIPLSMLNESGTTINMAALVNYHFFSHTFVLRLIGNLRAKRKVSYIYVIDCLVTKGYRQSSQSYI